MPGPKLIHKRQPALPNSIAELAARPLHARYMEARKQTEALCLYLTPEDCMVQSMPDASPVKWHLAHTTWFFETFVLTEYAKSYVPFNPEFRYVFNSYYNAVGERPQRDARGGFSRPSFAEVLDYRHHVDDAMQRLFASGGPAEIAQLVELGINHEQQHQELIVTDAKHALWSSPLQPPFRAVEGFKPAPPDSTALKWISFEAAQHEVGHRNGAFAFDNESPRHKVFVNDFQLASRLTTNAEYLDFINDRGYSRSELWLSEGFERARNDQWEAPLYWRRNEKGGWQHYTCFGWMPVEPNAPVTHVSYFEADAFARWSGARLATEFEWEVAARKAPQGGNLLDDSAFRPLPAKGFGLQQMFGDCWEWTSSSYAPYPGYKPATGALGEYNGKFMVNQYVLRGGSCATPRSHIRATYRNFFPTHARWQFSGIRLARSGK